jgi:antitoxin component YwqK of YwqJK toxin-antitoxin module
MFMIRTLIAANLILSLCGNLSFASQASALSCPSGTKRLAQESPEGKEERCVLRRSEKRHGPFQTWYPDGQLRQEGTYRYGQPQGRWTYYYPNGQKRMDGTWRFGKTQGRWTYFHENGSRESAGRFLMGKREGRWTYWDTAGEMRFEGDWTDGELNLDDERAAAAKRGRP